MAVRGGKDNTLEQCTERMDDHKTLKRLYKRAKKASKADKSNEELKCAKYEAKKALMKELVFDKTGADNNEDQVSSAKVTTLASAAGENIDSSVENETLENNRIAINRIHPTDGDKVRLGEDGGHDDGFNVNSKNNLFNIKHLEDAYHLALSAFKFNKTDKELRRAKTAARRALDDAILAVASAHGTTKQLTCVDCSKKFIYSITDAAQPKQKKRKGQRDNTNNNSTLPNRCQPCHSKRINPNRTMLDSQKRNMCYAFQKGECPHGKKCKFSHNPEYSGGKLPKKQSVERNDKK